MITEAEAFKICRNLGLYLGRIYVRRNIERKAASEFSYLVNRAFKFHGSGQSDGTRSLLRPCGSEQRRDVCRKDRD